MRFRFRTLLIVVALIAIVLSIAVPCYRRYEALRLLHDHRGAVFFEGVDDGYSDEPTVLNFLSRVDAIAVPARLRDHDLQKLLRQALEVRKLNLHASSISRESAALIGQPPKLEDFRSETRLSAEDLDLICRAPSLRFVLLLVSLEQAQIAVLGGRKSLTGIYVQFTCLTDNDLEQLIDRPRLDSISFSFENGAVPRKAIESLLKRHPQVQLMCFSPDPEGEQWWDELKKRFPEARISR